MSGDEDEAYAEPLNDVNYQPACLSKQLSTHERRDYPKREALINDTSTETITIFIREI